MPRACGLENTSLGASDVSLRLEARGRAEGLEGQNGNRARLGLCGGGNVSRFFVLLLSGGRVIASPSSVGCAQSLVSNKRNRQK